MKFRKWFAVRSPHYVGKRALILLDRYGITPTKAANRAESCVSMLAQLGCAPTLLTPGRVVDAHPDFIRRLQSAGAEIAVHSYDHVDLAAYPPNEASQQLVKAARSFARHQIGAYGFRCPYLSCTDELLDVLPGGLFDYSSNEAIWWDVVSAPDAACSSVIFEVLKGFYRPAAAQDRVCTPWMRSNMVEIPVCAPDDLQICDGLYLGSEGLAEAWSRILEQTHRRGELFDLLFHPEMAWQCQAPFVSTLRQAAGLRPSVWIARLRDVSNWWREKARFAAHVSDSPAGLRVAFACSERATVLARGLHADGVEGRWDGAYYRVRARAIDIPAEPRPFVGLPAGAPGRVASFLREQGYILDLGETASRCGVYLNHDALVRLTSEVALIDFIEASASPLVRYWRWPNGAKSALCVSGDLDALTLLDYASRLFIR